MYLVIVYRPEDYRAIAYIWFKSDTETLAYVIARSLSGFSCSVFKAP